MRVCVHMHVSVGSVQCLDAALYLLHISSELCKNTKE